MNNLIESFIKRMTKEDIIKFASKNNLKTTSEEIDFVFNFIKNNYQDVLKNPNKFDITLYKSHFSKDNYLFLEGLVNKYKKMII